MVLIIDKIKLKKFGFHSHLFLSHLKRGGDVENVLFSKKKKKKSWGGVRFKISLHQHNHLKHEGGKKLTTEDKFQPKNSDIFR